MKYMVLGALLVAAVLAGTCLGQVRLFPLTPDTVDILLDFRLPRVAFAAVNGAILALAGVLYQIALRNPMADGFTTGAASSAALGGCLALVLWGRMPLVSLTAVIFASIGIYIVRTVAAKAGGARVTIILAGIALSVMAGAGISFLKYFFENSISTMVFWLMGGLGHGTWLRTAVLFVILALALAFLQATKKQLALMFLDDDSAQASGVNVRQMRQLLFVATTVLVAVSVSFCGVIGFLGLMVPHAVRGLIGHSIGAQLAAAPLMGALALVVFDLLARVVLGHGGELPVGIITSLVGGIFFFGLLLGKGRRVWGD